MTNPTALCRQFQAVHRPRQGHTPKGRHNANIGIIDVMPMSA